MDSLHYLLAGFVGNGFQQTLVSCTDSDNAHSDTHAVTSSLLQEGTQRIESLPANVS